MDYDSFDLSRFEFADEKFRKANFFGRALQLYKKLPIPWAGIGHSPIHQKDEYQKKEPNEFFPQLFNAIGFRDAGMENVLSFHKRRVQTMRRTRTALGFILYLFCIVSISIIVPFLRPIESHSGPAEFSFDIIAAKMLFWGVLGLILALPSLLIAFIVTQTIRRITAALTSRKYADTLCILTAAYIVVELSRDTVLNNSDQRILLLDRLNDLAKNTLFLGRRFASKSARGSRSGPRTILGISNVSSANASAG